MARIRRKDQLFESTKEMVKAKDDLIAEFLAKGGKVTVGDKVDPYKYVDTIAPATE